MDAEVKSGGTGRGEGPQTAADELAKAWALLNRPVDPQEGKMSWPTLADVTNDIRSNNYSDLFSETSDVKASPKVLCANGVMCTCRVEWFGDSGSGYSGMFRNGEADHGLLRLSSALGDISGSLPAFAGKISQSKVFPCVALKLFRGNSPSANLVFGGKKTGQPEWNFFEHSVCTNLTEKVSFWLQWIIGLFRLYSSYPTQSGLSEFAQIGTSGVAVPPEEVRFPWCLLLRPVYSNDSSGDIEQYADESIPPYMKQLLSIPPGSVLYDIFCIPDPLSALGVLTASTDTSKGVHQHLQRIGRIVSSSPCVWSVYDKEVFFKHQKKEDDYAFRPDWEGELSDEHRNIGAANIDKLIDAGIYEDFE